MRVAIGPSVSLSLCLSHRLSLSRLPDTPSLYPSIYDPALGGPQPLAQALVEVLKRGEPPICVGLYARWGAGKTFMISLLKKEFDPYVYEDPHTRQLLQFFEKGYPKSETKQAKQTVGSLIYSLLTTLLTFLPRVPYGVATFFSIVGDAFDPRNELNAARAWCSKLMRACIPGVVWSSCSKLWYSCIEKLRIVWADLKPSCLRCCPCVKISPQEYQSVPQAKSVPRPMEKEFIFVDFNAWECAANPSV